MARRLVNVLDTDPVDDCHAAMTMRAALWEEKYRLETRLLAINRTLFELDSLISVTERILDKRDDPTQPAPVA